MAAAVAGTNLAPAMSVQEGEPEFPFFRFPLHPPTSAVRFGIVVNEDVFEHVCVAS